MLSTACLEELFGSSNQGILLLNPEAAVLWCNGVAEDLFGGDTVFNCQGAPFALLGTSPATLERPHEFQGMLQQAREAIGPIEGSCHILPGFARRERWLSCSVQYLHFGAFAGSLLLRCSEAPAAAVERVESPQDNLLPPEIRRFFDDFPDPLWHISAQHELLGANAAAMAMLADETAVTGRHCFAVLRQRSTPCIGCPADKSRISGVTEIAELEIGTDRTVQVRAFPFPAQTKGSGGFLVHERDLTEHLRLRELAFQTMPLVSLGELAASVAHEINNPATGIINCAQLLFDRLEKDHRDIARRILREGERISAIVRNLLSLARIGHDKTPGVKIEEELQDLLLLTQAQMRKDRITLVLRLAPDLPAVTANSQQIRQVFLNLINNARYALNQKFPDGSQGKILEIHGEPLDRRGVRFIFHDYGTGIPKSVLPKISHPFFTTKPVGRGTGLGLSISHSIIAEHGGTLEFESAEGEFTRAIIELPVSCDERLL